MPLTSTTIRDDILRAQLGRTIVRTDLTGLGEKIEGKVRDSYLPGDGRRILVCTDRLSAFDVVLGTIPFKGQVLNQLAQFWFDETLKIAPNHVLSVPDPNVTIGRDVTIGHMVMLHGCAIGDGSLIGIGSVILNGARIGRNCLIGAKTLIGEGKEIPDNSLAMGMPGKVVREVTAEQAARMVRGTQKYVANWRRFKAGLALTAD